MARIFEALDCEMTPDEVRERGELLASLQAELRAVGDSRFRYMATSRLQMDELRKRIEALSDNIVSKTEKRPVELRIEYDVPRAGMKRVWRTDMDCVIREEPMSDAELQHQLDLREEWRFGEWNKEEK